ncbi:MAG: cell division protein FtsX [Bacteroidetes bacterium HGW-Bacteroidetes-1]|jgi:cell division transport system permease protein|nr:MAG: cell division protein FtsX [Bacteroidetes bacterium HGW-Bacteroidetes-1]
MSYKEEKYTRRRLTGSYITSIVSTSLVLFVLGLFGLVVLNAGKLSELIKENIGFEIIMKEGVKEANIIQLRKSLDVNPHVKSTQYITKEEATKRLAADLGEDFIQWLGKDENPLLPSIEVKFKASWANNDSLDRVEKRLLENKDVKEVYYQKSLVHLINQNIKRIGIILFFFSILLLIISIALINNTIRLSIYARRFLIRSMQLVGATEGFIRKPFVIKSIIQGMIGAIVALLLLSGVLYLSLENIPELMQLQDYNTILMLYGAVLVLGMVLTGLSTFFAMGKYLKTRTDKLFV